MRKIVIVVFLILSTYTYSQKLFYSEVLGFKKYNYSTDSYTQRKRINVTLPLYIDVPLQVGEEGLIKAIVQEEELTSIPLVVKKIEEVRSYLIITCDAYDSIVSRLYIIIDNFSMHISLRIPDRKNDHFVLDYTVFFD